MGSELTMSSSEEPTIEVEFTTDSRRST